MAYPAINSQIVIRKRKRHFNGMSIIKLILLGCCLTLCKQSLLAQAKETGNNNTNSTKGENMLLNIQEDLQANKKDLASDSEGTFKRLKPLDYKDLTAKVEEDLKLIGEEDSEEIDEHSSEVIEMIQPAHNLRHQEHYKQRIIMAAKQQEQEKKHNTEDDIDNIKHNDDHNEDYDHEEPDEEISQHNRNLRYQQIQLALREPITSSTPPTPKQQTPSQEQHQNHHHRRHEHHLFRENQAKQTEFLWPQPHHLRHQHQHHKQQQQFQPQQLHHNHGFNPIRKQNRTDVLEATKSKLPSRYFDRESSATNPWSKMFTTEGPHLRHSKSAQFWRSKTYKTNPHNRLYNDDNFLNLETNNKENSPDKNDNNNNDDNDDDVEREGEDIKRFSLPLEGQEIDKETKQKTNANDNDPEISNNNKNQLGEEENEGDDEENDDDEDYSYEDDDKEINKSLKYPTITAQSKTNVKRYTRPLNRPHVSSSSSSFTSSSYGQRSSLYNPPHLRHTASTIKMNSNQNNDNDDDDYEEDDIMEKSSTNTNTDNANNDGDEDDDSDEDKFSDEKWNKIEHEHYRKQLQHQRAMQALRAKRPATATTTTNINNNTPTININRYASYTPPGSSASYNSAWTKRQTNNNEDEGENIYSRYYVPGSVTRKKEEELGSPTAILEARRQYALQQRKNKALASAHHRRIVTEGSCRLPQPRVERIRRDSWKIYTPHCTILHRCADDAGCCPSERQTCAPKRTKEVDLYFFVISLNETQGSIEKLTFVNHTECHCVERSKQRAPEYGSSSAKDISLNNQIPFLRRATILNCHCPNLFEKILQEDGYCRCDCSSGNMGCDWLKRGMEHFSMNDRKCIMEGRCKLPTCEYGQYIKKHGRCPRREERHLTADVDW